MAIFTEDIVEDIRNVVATHGGLTVDVATLGEGDDLFRAGMTSLANVNVLLALEAVFGIEFPEELLHRSTFESLSAISGAVRELLVTNGAG